MPATVTSLYPGGLVLATLAAASLHDIRDLGLLTADLLGGSSEPGNVPADAPDVIGC